jgi:DNA topoisomerase-2
MSILQEIRLSQVRSFSDDKNAHFEIFMDQKNIEIAEQEVLEKKFNLVTTVGTTNMHLFDMTGLNVRKYKTPEESE